MASKNQAIEKYNAGKVQSALNIAKNFKLGVTDDERNIMATGYECYAHGDTYVQMGYDLEKCKADAEVVLRRVLGIEEAAPVVKPASVTSNDNPVEWILVMKYRASGRKYVQRVTDADIDARIKASRQTGYTFICTPSRRRLEDYLFTGNEYGMREVKKQIEKHFAGEDVHECIQKIYQTAVEAIPDSWIAVDAEDVLDVAG